MNWKPFTIILCIVLLIAFLNSLYPVFNTLIIPVLFLIPLISIGWIAVFITGFRRNWNYTVKLGWITFFAISYLSVTYTGFYFHQFDFIRKRQADNTVSAINEFKKTYGKYPKNLDILNITYIPFTRPVYYLTEDKNGFGLWYNIGLFEDATYVSKDSNWYYGD